MKIDHKDKKREWTYVAADAAIALQIWDLKNNLFHCDVCGIDVYGKNEIKKHFEVKHPQENVENQSHFSLDWLTVIPGYDHYRLNFAKSIAQAFWQPYFKNIFIELGYETPAALNVAFSCGDLHKVNENKFFNFI